MKCKNCNSDLTGTENFCRKCGFPVKKEEEKLVSEESNSNDNKQLSDTSIDLNEVLTSNLIKKDEKYKIENTQELLVNNIDSSKKIKKILDELKSNKKDEDISSSNDPKLEDEAIKKEFEENKKKIQELEKNKNDNIDDKTIIVETPIINEASVNEDISNDNKEIETENTNKSESNDYDKNNVLNELVEKNDEESNNSSNVTDEKEDELEDNDIVYEENNSSTGTGKFIFVLLLFILSLCIIVYLLITNFSLRDKVRKNENESNKPSEKVSNKTSNVVTSNSNKVSFGCYNINSLSNITIGDSFIELTYNNLDFIFSIDSNVVYENIKNTKDEYKKLLESKKYLVASYGTKVVEEREYVFFEVTDQLKNKYFIVYTKGLNNDSFVFVIKNVDKTINFDNLKTINNYINTLKCENNNKITLNDYFIKK